MLLTIRRWLACVRQALGSRYVRMLEDELVRTRTEIAHLRLENRAMLNSLLGTAGVPPVEEPRTAPLPIQAIRRRSWPQIAAARESEAARQAPTPNR